MQADDDSPGILDHAMTKGEAHPNHLEKPELSTEQPSGTWNQGEDSRVTYSNNGEDDVYRCGDGKE